MRDLLPDVREHRRCYGDERLAEAEREHRKLKKKHRSECEKMGEATTEERAWWAWRCATEESIAERKLKKMSKNAAMKNGEWRWLES